MLDQNSPTTKLCSECKQNKHTSDFFKHIRHSDGLSSKCKQCHLISCKKYRDKNKEKLQIYFKQHHIKNKEKHNIQSKIDYIKNKDLRTKQNKQWYLTHKKQISEYKKNWKKSKLKTDKSFKLLITYRNRLGLALKSNQKSGHTIQLLMCTIEYWKKHLETLWTEGMSWDNYGNKEGQWSIDHIIPCSFFDLTDPVEQYMCFRWQNTRPMWHIDNMRKNAKLLHVNDK